MHLFYYGTSLVLVFNTVFFSQKIMLVPFDPGMEQTVKYLEDLTKLVTRRKCSK